MPDWHPWCVGTALLSNTKLSGPSCTLWKRLAWISCHQLAAFPNVLVDGKPGHFTQQGARSHLPNNSTLSNCPLPSIIGSRVTNWVRKLQTALTTCEGDYLHKAQVAEIMLASCHKLSGSSHQFTVYFDACCKDTGIVNSLYIKMLIIKTQEQMWLYFPMLQNVLK